MAPTIPVSFVGAERGQCAVRGIEPVTGPSLPNAACLAIHPSHSIDAAVAAGGWVLRGTAGHVRYVERSERDALVAIQAGLGRSEASRAALIPIRKSAAWWDLAQDERREILETASHHIGGSMKYLPAIARRLYQARELGEPFDFLTWFEYAPEHAAAFEELVATLRATEEWKYVEREVDIRLERAEAR